MTPPYRDPRDFQEMWETASEGERWLVVVAIPILVLAVCVLGYLG